MFRISLETFGGYSHRSDLPTADRKRPATLRFNLREPSRGLVEAFQD